MKKLLLATAIAALSVSAANAAPTVYGKAFVHADYVNSEVDYNDVLVSDNDEDSVQINSTGSKIGLRGSEALTANTDVIYQLEYGINVDGDGNNNESDTFKSRDTYLGLDNKDYGQFRFGRNFSVIDNINNIYRTEGLFDNIGPSTLNKNQSTVGRILTMTDGDRINNSIVWLAPKYNGLPLEFALQYGADETFVSDNGDRDSGYGASLMYNANTGFTAGIAYDKDMSINGDIVRGTASVDLGKYMAYPVTLGALYQEADYDRNGSEKEKGLIVSAEMALSNFARPAVAYLQYDKTDNLAGVDNFDGDQIVIGGKYEYKSNMIAHAYAGVNSAERSDLDADVFAIGGGLEYIF